MYRINPNKLNAEDRDAVRRSRLAGKFVTMTIRSKSDSSTVYFYEDRHGRPAATAFKGKSLKPAYHVYYRDYARRAAHCKEWLEALKADRERKAEARRARNKPHTLKVGTVLRSMWGYEQTNIDYYEVVALKGKTMVTVRKIAAESEGTLWMQGDSTPVPGSYISEPENYKVDGTNNSIRIASFAIATPMEPLGYAGGRPIFKTSHWTAYA